MTLIDSAGADVHENDVGAVKVDRAEHLEAVGGLGHDLEARHAGEHHPQTGAHERVIVDEQDSDHRDGGGRGGVAQINSGDSYPGPRDSTTRAARSASVG